MGPDYCFYQVRVTGIGNTLYMLLKQLSMGKKVN